MDKTELVQELTKAGLTRLVQSIDQITHSSLYLATSVVDEKTLPVGSSKLGGSPDLPSDLSWPQLKGKPQSFIAQLCLTDLPRQVVQSLLPAEGMLWFFYDAQQQTFGEKPADKGGWSVLFSTKEPGKLQRQTFPQDLASQSQFKACSIAYKQALTLSAQPQLEIPGLPWTDADQEKYDQIFTQFQDEVKPPRHRILGDADTLQDDMRLQCQLMTHGISDIKDSRADGLAKEANDWLLLLQIDTDEAIGMKWASTGTLYYWLSGSDMQSKHFENSWFILQSE